MRGPRTPTRTVQFAKVVTAVPVSDISLVYSTVTTVSFSSRFTSVSVVVLQLHFFDLSLFLSLSLPSLLLSKMGVLNLYTAFGISEVILVILYFVPRSKCFFAYLGHCRLVK